ncbi:MAG: putative toxin-antitoxin system toxin component, PIN family [Candidatus Bathyarchaeia archaeon]|nr:putative toxin-antitoxin system toxin component, PIN family [Candidatus Bathyarchaeota archaeon]
MKIVLDTNVLLSALIKSGKPRELIFKIADGKAQLILSRGILEEFLEVTEELKIRRYVDEGDIIAFVRVLGAISKIVSVRSKFKIINEDPPDDVILRTAKDGRADYIVSGDKHLLLLGEFRGIKIVSVSEMLRLLEEDASV